MSEPIVPGAIASEAVVSLTNVQVRFGGGRVRAVDTVSLEVGRGEVVALVGVSEQLSALPVLYGRQV